jgi:hypothetical protein
MLQSIERQLSGEDSQYIEAHQLGIPLAIYRYKPAYIHILRERSLFILVICLVYLFLFSVKGDIQNK